MKTRGIVEPAEWFVLKLLSVLLLVNAFLIFKYDAMIDWESYKLLSTVLICIFLCGQLCRVFNVIPNIGLILVCFPLFSAFWTYMVLFSHVVLPSHQPRIDQALIWIDSLYGFHWPDYMAWGADNPFASKMLKYAYESSGHQMTLLLVFLALTERKDRLHVMMITALVSCAVTILTWWVFQNHGASAYFDLAPRIEEIIQPTLNMEYGREIMRMSAEGPGLISAFTVKGLVSFPSYHTIMALICIYFMRDIKLVFPVVLVINVMVILATPLHGGHHVVDIFGGVLVFIVCTIWAERLVVKLNQKSDQPAAGNDELAGPVAA